MSAETRKSNDRLAVMLEAAPSITTMAPQDIGNARCKWVEKDRRETEVVPDFARAFIFRLDPVECRRSVMARQPS